MVEAVGPGVERLKVGDEVFGVPSIRQAGAFVTGSPAFPHAEWRRASVVFRHLPSMKKHLEELEQRMVELEEKLAACQTPKDR